MAARLRQARAYFGASVSFSGERHAGKRAGNTAIFYGVDRAFWSKELRDAEAELAAARSRSEVNAAAKRLQQAKAELKALEDVRSEPKRQPNRGRASGASSS
jgi:hypothetical protein